MKNSWNIILLFLFLCFSGGFIVSCTDDMDGKNIDEGLDKINLRVQFNTKADNVTSDVQKLNDNEYRIRSIRLYAFDGEILDNMVYKSGLDNTAGIEKIDIAVKPGSNKTFYAVVNEPDIEEVHSALALANHPNGIKQVQYSIANYLNSKINALTQADKYYLPMYKELDKIDISKTSTNLNIDVDRAVARIDLYMIKANGITASATTGNASLKVERSIGNGYIATDNILSTNSTSVFVMNQPKSVTLKEYSTNYADYTKVYSFYVPEQTCEDEAHRLRFTLGGITWDNQTMSEPYKTFYLGNDISNSEGKILNKITRNQVYQIYCRIKPTTKEVSFNIVTLPWNLVPTQEEESEKGEISMVNCYMVTPGGSVSIPVANVYRFWAWSDDLPTPEPISKDMEVYPEVIWSDTEDLITSVGLITSASTDNKDHARIRVQTASGKQGNAVVGMRMKDSDGNLESNYRWSWHIWVTDYNPEKMNYVNNGFTIMDRSLGAMINTYDDASNACGLYYQWGRKDPFTGVVNWSTEEKEIFPSGKFTFNPIVPSTVNNLPNSIKYPYNFYVTENSPFDWYTTFVENQNPDLWNKGGKKTIYDPCPEGWRIPFSTLTNVLDGSPWEGLTKPNFPYNNSTNSMSNDMVGWYAVVGSRDSFDGSILVSGRQTTATIWMGLTRTAAGYIQGDVFSYNRLVGVSKGTQDNAMGMAVRCVKE